MLFFQKIYYICYVEIDSLMSARLSSYVIFTELDDSDNKYMLVHGCTGAIDIASESIVSYLQSEDILTPETAPFSQKTWDTLVARGYITAKTAEEEYAFAGRMAEVFHKRSKLFNSFIFIPSYDCNFRCPYCIEGQMSCDGKNGRSELLRVKWWIGLMRRCWK